jgi:hypothetical protein
MVLAFVAVVVAFRVRLFRVVVVFLVFVVFVVAVVVISGSGVMMMIVARGEFTEKPHQPIGADQERQRDGSGCDVGSQSPRIVAPRHVIDNLQRSLVAIAPSGPTNTAEDQQDCERRQRQQRCHDIQLAGVFARIKLELEHGAGYPFSSSAVSTSTVVWLL